MRCLFVTVALLSTVIAIQEDSSLDTGVSRTNADRFARGLPPMPPRRRSGPHYPRASNSPPITASRACSIHAYRSDGTSYGIVAASFLSKNTGTGGTYGAFTTDPSSALEITFSYTYDSSSTTVVDNLQIQTTNGPSQSTYGYIGLVRGTSGITTIDSSSPAFVFLTGVTSAAGSASANFPNAYSDVNNVGAPFAGMFDSPAESVVWSYEPSTGDLGLSWTNADGTRATNLEVGIYEPSGCELSCLL
ncbi:hypothetical protein C8F01DRAFT_488282 [Mycena amicta]|nr:hypothetical protein C8F01DRAFT_488282 [Mycena amicta]